jgi:signal transduction histidine kinase/ligand-binding sensor domain-containing protein
VVVVSRTASLSKGIQYGAMRLMMRQSSLRPCPDRLVNVFISRVARLLITALLLCQVATVFAGDRPWTLARFQHTAWLAKDGAPVAISTLAQTSDGMLWVGGGAGLYTFDGHQFSQFTGASGKSLVSSQVTSLCAARDGSLWIGYESGGISHLVAGALINYDISDGYVASNTTNIVEARDGTIWTASPNGLMHFSNGKWVLAGAANGLKEGSRVVSLLITEDGTLWTTQDGGILELKDGSSKFLDAGKTLENKKVFSLSAAPDGLMIGYVNGPMVRYLRQGDALAEVPNTALPLFGIALFDRRGSLWTTGAGSGVTHVAEPQSWYSNPGVSLDKVSESYKKADGLTGDYVWPILEDTEGDVWVGTSEGLDRFRTADFALANTPSGAHDFALAPASQGKIWSGSSTNPVMLLGDNDVAWTTVPAFTLAVCRDANDGTVWAANRQGIWQLRPDGSVFVTPLPRPALPFALARDSHSTLWLAIGGSHGLMLYSYADGKWSPHPEQAQISALSTSRSGELWIGKDSRIDVIGEGRSKSFTGADGVDVGLTHAFAEDSEEGGMWVGGSAGLGYLEHGRFHKATLDDAMQLSDITAILFAQDGSLWLHTLKGVIRIASDTVRTFERHPDTPMSYRLFDTSDGVVGLAGQAIPLPSGTMGTDGRLWFSTSSGVLWVDPARLISRGPVPPIHMGPIVVDGEAIKGSSVPRLPALSRNIHLAFNAQTLSHPEGLTYRIRLEPLGDSWQEVGAKHEITYATLGPGRYTFRVQARRGDGAWQEPGSSLTFTVEPAFYQTYGFYAMCLLLLVLAAWFAYTLNIRKIARQSQVRFNERTWERERIARELHDTMLQDMQVLSMHLRQIESREHDDAAVQNSLARANELATNALDAARKSVKHLRDSGQCADLVVALVDAVDHLKRHYKVPVHLSTVGKEQRLQGAACEEVLAIAREAILNALKHANATMVGVHVNFSQRSFVLRVQDDGVGIDSELLSQREAEGHWGLKGMNERAMALGGVLNIRAVPLRGTEVVLRLSSTSVYATL